MKTSQTVWLLLAGLIAGLSVGGNITGPTANAQGIPNAVATPRFQISAWASHIAGNGTGNHGCYIADTVTGELWLAAADGKVTKISEKQK
jgi:hypothetical protein